MDQRWVLTSVRRVGFHSSVEACIDSIEQRRHDGFMRLGDFDMNLLVVLDALLGAKSVVRASERLHIGASATSSALSRLREHFEDELLIQVGRRMELTPLAESLVEPVRDILLSVQSTVILRPEFVPENAKRDFVIRTSDYLTAVLLTKVVQRLQREAPGIKVHIANMSDDVGMQLERGEVDLVIYPASFSDRRYPSDVLFEDTFTCVAWAGNDEIGESIDLDQYLKLGHVAATFGDSRSPGFEGVALAECGLTRFVEVSTTNFNTLPLLVVGTTRIATIQTRLAQFFSRLLPLRLLPVPLELPVLTEVMQWHSIKEQDPAHTWLRKVIMEEAGTHVTSSEGL